jgi:hypothetical protein
MSHPSPSLPALANIYIEMRYKLVIIILITASYQSSCCNRHDLCRYEKKRGLESEWYEYIKELDRQRARGPLAAESPILWTAEEVEQYLKGSSAVTAWKERMASLQEEFEGLDTVWFMSGSLFSKYPYDVPTEAFSFELFKQAFAAVQASVVHLQVQPHTFFIFARC